MQCACNTKHLNATAGGCGVERATLKLVSYYLSKKITYCTQHFVIYSELFSFPVPTRMSLKLNSKIVCLNLGKHGIIEDARHTCPQIWGKNNFFSLIDLRVEDILCSMNFYGCMMFQKR